MLVQLQKTVNAWNSRSHLLPFLQKAPVVICIKSEDEVAYIYINKGKVELLLEKPSHIDAELEGEKEILVNLLRGEIKLRQAKASNLVSLHSSFRTALHLETMLYLVKPYKYVHSM